MCINLRFFLCSISHSFVIKNGFTIYKKLLLTTLVCLFFLSMENTYAVGEKKVPQILKEWEDWATWDEEYLRCPTPYYDSHKPLCLWPSRLNLDAEAKGGQFNFTVFVYDEAWMSLPGDKKIWPFNVKVNGAAIPVVEHKGKPSVHLKAGSYKLTGEYRWDELPQQMRLPAEIGILALTLEGKHVDAPVWDAEGILWFKQARVEEADKDFFEVKIYRVIEDGIPMWLRTKVEVSVSGKSREEAIGSILPEGWQLGMVDSPIPVAVDDRGRMKLQVRPGKWIVHIDAFRLDHAANFQYANGEAPAVEEELIAFRSKPDFRMVEVTEVSSVDVSQTTFPQEWRALPVYHWETSKPFHLEERMRGMGLQKPEGLKITRELWLNENGRYFIFRDRIHGHMQQLWRLDANEDEKLGAVRNSGQGQLITRNPKNNSPGIEIRSRNLNLEAVGSIDRSKALSATGWRVDADELRIELNLPPGWRLFALFGADWVTGDWLTSWTLLDLFLLLVFSLATYKLWGVQAGLLAFFAFGLAYHEPSAPRYIWLLLLLPLALLRVVNSGWTQQLIVAWKYLTIAGLLFILVPFIATEIQHAIYPQLEERGNIFYNNFAANVDMGYKAKGEVEDADVSGPLPPPQPAGDMASQSSDIRKGGITSMPVTRAPMMQAQSAKQQAYRSSSQLRANLAYDARARIQTGPAVPEWRWNSVSFGWNGPVQASQKVYPILISLGFQRLLTLIRIGLLLYLAAVLLDLQKIRIPLLRISRAACLLIVIGGMVWGMPSPVRAEIPDEDILQKLHDRLLKPSDAYPTAADIASVSLNLRDRHLTMDVEVHAAIQTGVPLPGRFPAWSPISVSVDGKSDAALLRYNGYLWVVLSEGVHHIRVEGLIPSANEWEWAFLLKPHHVTVDAPGWAVSGIRPDGVPEQQVFFVTKQKSTTGEANYNSQNYRTIASLDRNLELGLTWQVHNVATRLSSQGKAVSLRVPLIEGEKVLSSNVVQKDGYIEIHIGAHENSFSWESELPTTSQIVLNTKKEDTWVERWYLITSPIWNVSASGLSPVFQADTSDLIPVWYPWPGESVKLTVNRPEAINGATVTIRKASHDITFGKRQRSSRLNLDLEASLGEDFQIDLPEKAEITDLTHDGRPMPVRKDGTHLIIPLHPSGQKIDIKWKTNELMGLCASADRITFPVESSNIATTIHVPEDQWLLWAYGPLRGPAVRFWGILACSLLIGWILSRLPFSPLKPIEWMLLAIGLTQIELIFSFIIVGWFFFLTWRGQDSFQKFTKWKYNILQITLILLSIASLGIFIYVVSKGLLGSPEMFIKGNNSYRTVLNWYQPQTENILPQPGCIAISIWWYRLFMLAWALWLASSLVRWIAWGWRQFSCGGIFRRIMESKIVAPPTMS